MRIYLAGKIEKNGWRQSVCNGAEKQHGDYGAFDFDCAGRRPITEADSWPVERGAVLGEHDYTGPYVVRCDHGCAHGDSLHGIGRPSEGLVRDRKNLIRLCLTAIRYSDLVFAWIYSQDCYGTLVELGYAAAAGCKIAVAVPKYLDDLWFATEMAGYIICGEPDPAKALTEAIAWACGSKVEAV
mgnify:CR=1 FL=1